jgi:hypothetical protein
MSLDTVETISGASASLPAGVKIAVDRIVNGPETATVQIVKLGFGADGTLTTVEAGAPLPVAITNPSIEISNDSGNPVPVVGVVGVSGSVTIANSSLEISNDAGNPVPVSGSVAISGEVEVKNDAGNPLSVLGPLTDVQLRAVALPVSIAAARGQQSGNQCGPPSCCLEHFCRDVQ